jgi:pimeloyl-ACP methyl ester carboxylesterase
MRVVLLLVLLGALAAPATASAQTPGIPPPGANDFACRSAQHPVPVILVHGTFGDMTVSWNALSPLLVLNHYCVFALDLVNRGMAPMDQSADKLAAFIDEVRQKTGAAKVSLVGHSQGGMLGRYVARFRGKLGVIDDIVGLAPSSHGTTQSLAPPLGGLGCPACAEQAAGSDFMKKLNAGQEAPPPPSYTVVSTKYDEVVTPYKSQALSGSTVTNVVLQDRCKEDVTDHVGIIYDPIALQWVLNALGRPGPADPAFRPLCTDGLADSPPQAFATAKKPRVGRHRISGGSCCATAAAGSAPRRSRSAPTAPAPCACTRIAGRRARSRRACSRSSPAATSSRRCGTSSKGRAPRPRRAARGARA